MLLRGVTKGAKLIHKHMSKERRFTQTLLAALRYIPVGILVVLMTVFVLRNGVAAINMLVEEFSNRLWLTTAAFMGLFLLKSVSFGLPYALLYIGVGSLYPIGWALIVNTVGIMVNMQIPYFFGRHAGSRFVERLGGRFPRIGRLEDYSHRSAFFLSFLVKFIGKIPHEITNALLGSLNIPYIPYMIGGILGVFPTMAATTLVGTSLHDPGSPLFIISLMIVIILTVFSFLLYRRQLNSE